MEVQEIRAALINKGVLLRNLPMWANTTTILVEAAAEYADLLEASERIWWCEYVRAGQIGESFMCEDLQHKQRGCGWRLLTKGEA